MSRVSFRTPIYTEHKGQSGGVRGVLPPLEEKIFDTGCAITPMEGTVARCVLFNPIDTVASAHWV